MDVIDTSDVTVPYRSERCGLAAAIVLSIFINSVAAIATAEADDASPPVMLVHDGTPQMPIIIGSVDEPAEELRSYLQRMSGATFSTERGEQRKAGVYVGLASDFPWIQLDKADDLGPEGFVLKSDDNSVYILAQQPLGVRHAVTTFLHSLGCRWFFPGDIWEVVPNRRTIAGYWNQRQTPSFATQRRIWYGYGAYAQGKADLAKWNRHNRMGGPVDVSIGHTWHGLDAERDFAQHRDWFALVDGQRRPDKPCYSNPHVIERAIASALRQAEQGQTMISMTPPDGLGYCECDLCRSVFQGAQPVRQHSTLFARRADGKLVNITSETLFAMVNKVAAAVAEKYPDVLIGCYAYSAYSHPPSFSLHPNVYLQTTTAFRRTPITLDEQLTAFGRKTRQLGIREYYSAYQWDWDEPSPGKLTPSQLQSDLRFFRQHGVTAVNAESSNNWGPRGVGYYVAAQLMWDIDQDPAALVRDFYEKAFGPAAPAMQRYYARWYGQDMVVLADSPVLLEQRTLTTNGQFDVAALREAMRDLDDAAKLVDGDAPYRQRINLLRMYVHYLTLRYRLYLADQSREPVRIVTAIREETVFGGRLADTHMIHSRPLIGKAFFRRFKNYESLLASVPESQQAGKGWRQLGQPPTRDELDKLWAADKALLRAQ